MKGMTRFLWTACAVVAVAAFAASTSAGGGDGKAELGETAPDFTLVDTNGDEKSLSDYKGKIVVLEWINPQCPYVVNCYKSKAMQNAQAKLKEMDKSIVWLAINTTSGTSAQENELWIKKYSLNYPILLDATGEVGRLYDARRTPHMFVIDKEGLLKYHGAIDNNKFLNTPDDEIVNYVVGAVRQVVDGETVAPDFVKPYGCTVKYPLKKG